MRQSVWMVMAVGLAGLVLAGCGGSGSGAGQPVVADPPQAPAPAPSTPAPPAPVVPAPSAPRNLTATGGNQQVVLSWAASSGAESYSVFQSTTPSGQGSTPVQQGITGTSATLVGLVNGTAYFFRVRARNSAGESPSSTEATATPAATTGLTISRLQIAQTHVQPEGGKSWAPPTPPMASENLHLTGGRNAVALVGFEAGDAQNPMLDAVSAGTVLGSVVLQPPETLPPTESNGPAYGTGLYTATLPAAWMLPGVALRARADNYLAGELHALKVGADMPYQLRVLPFYLFGANDSNSGLNFTQVSAPPAAATEEMLAKLPVATLATGNHPATRVNWPTLVVPPRLNSSNVAQPAYVLSNSTQQREGFAALSAVLNLLGKLRAANGESPLPVQYYAPLVMLNSSMMYAAPGGGLGGGDVAAGDHLYSGIFIHELGHGFGLPHQGEAFDDGEYPYDWGSLNGSLWGYDIFKRQFLGPFVPGSAARFGNCANNLFDGRPRAVDAAGRCVKQDPMQSGAGDQASNYRFATFSDYSTAMMQRHLEGVTTINSDGTRNYSGGKLVADASFPGGYKRWDTLDRRWVNVEATTQQGGIFGLNRNLPVAQNVPVHAIAVTISNAGTAGATQIYPPFSYTGNRLQYIDPTLAADRSRITPDTGQFFWYCRNGGCDYTVRVTYAGGMQRNVLLQGGFRPFNEPSGTPPASATTATDGNSFRSFVIHVPNDAAITQVQLLSTPMVWQGMPPTPAVLATRAVTS